MTRGDGVTGERGSASAPDRSVALALGAIGVVVYLLSIIGHTTAFDYFGRLAEALAQGRYWLDGAPPHLNELAVGVGGHAYSVVPPLPAILLVPLLPFGDPAKIQTFLSALAGGASAAPLYLALRGLRLPRSLAITSVTLSTFGTTLWVSAADGRSWFAADAIAVLLLSLAFWAAVAGASPVLVGVALGAAALARLPLVLAVPAFLLLMSSRRPVSIHSIVMFAAGIAPFAAIEATYNLARWGTPFEVGYALLAADEPLYARGLFSLSYLPRHLYAILFEPPAFVDNDLFFLRARSIGMSVLFATPAMLWLARVPLIVRSFPPAIPLLLGCLPLVPDLLFGTVGFEQYGYRRGLDAHPFLIALVGVAAGWNGGHWRERLSPLFGSAVALSVVGTVYFLVTIRLFGFAR